MRIIISKEDVVNLIRAVDGHASEGHVIQLLVNVRRDNLYKNIFCALENGEANFAELIREHEENLVNPCLVPSLLSMALNEMGDTDLLLHRFFTGEPMHGFDEALARVDIERFDWSRIESFLNTETRYHLGLYNYLANRHFAAEFVHWMREPITQRLATDCYNRNGIKEFNNSQKIDVHGLRFNAWYQFNMTFSFNDLIRSRVASCFDKRGAAVLFAYTINKNSFWHNTRQICLLFYERAKKSVNLNPLDKNRLHELDLAERLLSRAEKFYWWNPCEADAHSFGDTAANGLKEMIASWKEEKIDEQK